MSSLVRHPDGYSRFPLDGAASASSEPDLLRQFGERLKAWDISGMGSYWGAIYCFQSPLVLEATLVWAGGLFGMAMLGKDRRVKKLNE